MTEPHILLFDDSCALCRAFVRFVLARDRFERVRVAPLGTMASRATAIPVQDSECACLPGDSVLLRHGTNEWAGDEAILRVLSLLSTPWRIFSWLRIVPSPIRRWLYRVVAHNRGKWSRFVRPIEFSAAEKERFL